MKHTCSQTVLPDVERIPAATRLKGEKRSRTGGFDGFGIKRTVAQAQIWQSVT
jgi:hypothetical protein